MKPKSQIEKRMDGIDNYGGGVSDENIVVIRDTGLPEYLKGYTLIKPKTVDKSLVCDVRIPMISSGITMYENGSVAPNGVTVTTTTHKTDPAELPDVSYYLDVDFPTPSVYVDSSLKQNIELRGFKVRFYSEHDGIAIYMVDFKTYIKETGEAFERVRVYPTTELGYVGVAVVYGMVYPPGTEYQSINDNKYISEFGYADATLYFKRKYTKNNTVYYSFTSSDSIIVPFASIEEYNAAMVFVSAPQSMAELKTIKI